MQTKIGRRVTEYREQDWIVELLPPYADFDYKPFWLRVLNLKDEPHEAFDVFDDWINS